MNGGMAGWMDGGMDQNTLNVKHFESWDWTVPVERSQHVELCVQVAIAAATLIGGFFVSLVFKEENIKVFKDQVFLTKTNTAQPTIITTFCLHRCLIR